jgi:hypothetical protein
MCAGSPGCIVRFFYFQSRQSSASEALAQVADFVAPAGRRRHKNSCGKRFVDFHVRRALQHELESGVNNVHKRVSVQDSLAPQRIELAERFGGDGFVERLPGGLQFLHAAARGDEHVAKTF